MVGGDPQVHLRKDGAFFRVRVEPKDALPASVHVSETYVGHLSATMAAKVLANATGFPIIDHTKAGH